MTDDIPTDLTPEGKVAWLKIQGLNSCLHCAYLYFQDTGYSNYTLEDTEARCALDRNPRLPATKPYDWELFPHNDNWPATKNMACDQLLLLEEGYDRAWLDVDGEHTAWNYNLPREAQEAISGSKENS